MTAPPAQPDFGAEFRAYLYEAFGVVPNAERRVSHWVMSVEWLMDLMKLTGPGGRRLWEPPVLLGAPETLFGLPIEIRAGGGAPHLEA